MAEQKSGPIEWPKHEPPPSKPPERIWLWNAPYESDGGWQWPISHSPNPHSDNPESEFEYVRVEKSARVQAAAQALKRAEAELQEAMHGDAERREPAP